jgi:hypothetical protein
LPRRSKQLNAPPATVSADARTAVADFCRPNGTPVRLVGRNCDVLLVTLAASPP